MEPVVIKVGYLVQAGGGSLPAGTEGQFIGYGVGGVPVAVDPPAGVSDTGWAMYADTQYTALAPFSPTVGAWVPVPNNAGSKIESQMPADVDAFYDPVTAKIPGRNGDGISITVSFIARQDSGAATLLDVAFNIGGGLGALGDGRLYQRPLTFPKGQGDIRPVTFTVNGYTLNTWQANGAQFEVNASAAVSIYGLQYVITRTHRAR